MVALALLLAAGLVPQGNTLRVKEPGAAVLKAPWKEVPFFDGLALLAVPVRQPPGPYQLSVRDKSGALVRELSVTVTDAKFPQQNIQVTPGMSSLKSTDEEREVVHALLTAISPERSWTEPFRVPAPGCMNSRFGVLRFHNGKYSGQFHGGVDQRGRTGTPVRAAASGTVRVAGKYERRGGTVGIDHGQGVVTMYLHLSRVLVKPGQVVKKGQVVGRIGATGFATGPHLHWSVYVHGDAVNPLQWTPGVRACGRSR